MNTKNDANALTRGDVISLALLVADVCLVVLAAAISYLAAVYLWPMFFKEAEAIGCLSSELMWLRNMGNTTWTITILAVVLIAALVIKERLVASRWLRAGINGAMGLISVGYLACFVTANLAFVHVFLFALAKQAGQ